MCIRQYLLRDGHAKARRDISLRAFVVFWKLWKFFSQSCCFFRKYPVGNSSNTSYFYVNISVWDDSAGGDRETSCDDVLRIFTKRNSTNPSNPSNPSKDPDKAPAAPEATDNPANDDRTIADLASGEDTEVKLSNGSAGLSAETINTLGGHGSRLTIVNGGMSVKFPGGFGKVTEPGRIYYPFDYEESPRYAGEMLSAVRGVGVKSEARKVGGSMTLPGTASVTLKTKLTGAVNVYLYDEDTGRYTAIASVTAKDGAVTFPTNRMGYMVLTTGRI